MNPQRLTVNDIKTAVRATGSHWFDPGTMRFFGTRVLPTVYQGSGGVYFVTSDHDFNRVRRYSVRSFDVAKSAIGTVGEVASHKTAEVARKIARTMAAGNGIATETAAEFRPVSDAEQLLHDMHAHGIKGATADHVRKLMKLAARHHRHCEGQCNGDANADRNRARTERDAVRLADSLGLSLAFGGDPRGATVKAVFPDGATNDFGGEGWVIPPAERN